MPIFCDFDWKTQGKWAQDKAYGILSIQDTNTAANNWKYTH
jgi:hypothetical protein